MFLVRTACSSSPLRLGYVAIYAIVPAADPLSLRSSALWVVASSVLTCFARPRSGTFNGPRLVRYWVPCRPAMECLAFQQFHHQIRRSLVARLIPF